MPPRHRDNRPNERAQPCPVCRRPIRQPARGRPRRYCTNACRQVAYRQRNGQQRRRKLITLIEADAREWLPALPDESVDLIVTDPPYHFERGTAYFRDWFEELADHEWPAIFRDLHRVLRPDSHCYVFGDRRVQPLFDTAAREAGFRVHPPLVWDKCSIGLGGGAWRSQYELISFYEKGRRPGNSRNRSDVLRYPRVMRGYPTEKPVDLLVELIVQSSRPGELLLDPFCGSGNTGAAAPQLGRRALVCDLNTTVAARRLRLAATPR